MSGAENMLGMYFYLIMNHVNILLSISLQCFPKPSQMICVCFYKFKDGTKLFGNTLFGWSL